MARYAKITALSFPPVSVGGMKYDPELFKKLVMENLTKHIEMVAHEKSDLIILPECSNRPVGPTVEERAHFYHNCAPQIEEMMSDFAKKYDTNIAFAESREVKNPEDSEYPIRNSIVYFDRHGDVVGEYDKCYLVPTEHTITKIGFGKIPDSLIELDFGRVATAICFDMHDMVLMEKYASLNPDLIVFSSNFAARVWADVWAERCGAYFAAALGIGLHQSGRIINPFGDVIATTDNKRYASARINLDFRIIHEDDNQDWRTDKLARAAEKYGEGFNYINNRGTGLALIQSDMPNKTIDDIISEFGIIQTNEYFGEVEMLRKKYYESKKK